LVKSAQAASDKQAENIQILDLRGISDLSDFFLICSAPSQRQVKAISEKIMHILQQAGAKPHHTEGFPGSGWNLLDYGDVIFHIFQTDLREHYDLEGLWNDATRVPIAKESVPEGLPEIQTACVALT